MIGAVVAKQARAERFRPVLGQEQREAVGRFLLAQGWAGLHLGDALRRQALAEHPAESRLLSLSGPLGEVRGVALLQSGRLQLLAPLAEDLPAVAALVAEHIRLNHGSVWAEEAPGGGARFTVELPIESDGQWQ